MSADPKPIGRIEVPLVNPNEPEVQVIAVGVQPYERIARGDVVCTVETSKATVDVESELDGWTGSVAVAEGDRATVGDLICEVFDSRPAQLEGQPAGESFDRPPPGVRLTRKAEKLALDEGLDLSTLPTGRFLTESDIEAIIGRDREPGVIDPAILSRIHDKATLIFGAGGLAKTLIELMREAGAIEPVCVLNDRPDRMTDVLGVPVLGGREYLQPLHELGLRYAVNAVGAVRGIEGRIGISDVLQRAGFEEPALVHTSAVVAPSAVLAPGSQVYAGAVVGSSATVGRSAIVNTNAVVSHDCVIGDFVHVAPGALLAGEVEVGRGTLIGMGAAAVVYLKIGAGVIVGNGAVLNEDVPDGTIVHAGSIWPRPDVGKG